MDTQTYIDNGWKYSEFINWIPVDIRDQILYVLGDENVLILDSKEFKEKNLWKAKMLISPDGIKILNLFFLPAAGHA